MNDIVELHGSECGLTSPLPLNGSPFFVVNLLHLV